VHVLIIRIVTGIIGMAIAAYVIQYGEWLFSAVILLLSLIGWHEFSRAFAKKGLRLAYFPGMLALLFLWGCVWLGNTDEVMAVLVTAVLVILAKAVFMHASFSIEAACVSIAGIMYVGLLFSYLLLLRFMGADTSVTSAVGNMSLGCTILWLALIGTWASDTFAFFTGSLLGKHKLCPGISPNKTIEGFVGGILGTTCVVMGMGALFSFYFLHMAVMGICIALMATVGDLVESSFKRYTGIKDSGSLIPGHGGVLDRFDSVLFTVPFVYYYVQVFNIFG
jgi:phosphatidate cytidylyltransferase